MAASNNNKKQKPVPREERRRQDLPGKEHQVPTQKPGQQKSPSNPNQRW